MNKQTKIFMWTTARCLSTVIERPFLQKSNIKVVHEPFSNAYYFGPEKTSNRYDHEDKWKNETYQNISNKLQQKYDGYDTVFIKDMAYNIKKQYNLISNGFVHTFLIRNPLKVGQSLNKLISTSNDPHISFFDPIEMSFDAIYDLYKYVTDVLKQPSIIIDADDVLNNPQHILSMYCNKVGIEFTDNMLTWEATLPNPDWLVWEGWHDDAISCTGFRKPGENTKTIDDLPSEIKQCVIQQMPYYEKLYALRLQ